MKLLNYGFNVDFLSNQYGDFFIWRSPTEVYKPSPFTNMGREENNFHIDPFINYVNPETVRHIRLKDVSITVPIISYALPKELPSLIFWEIWELMPKRYRI